MDTIIILLQKNGELLHSRSEELNDINMKIYTKEDIYEGMTFRNNNGKGQLFKIIDIKVTRCTLREVENNTTINPRACIDAIVNFLNNGTYVEQEQEINYQIF